jgi:hypothetical protein
MKKILLLIVCSLVICTDSVIARKTIIKMATLAMTESVQITREQTINNNIFFIYYTPFSKKTRQYFLKATLRGSY